MGIENQGHTKNYGFEMLNGVLILVNRILMVQ